MVYNSLLCKKLIDAGNGSFLLMPGIIFAIPSLINAEGSEK